MLLIVTILFKDFLILNIFSFYSIIFHDTFILLYIHRLFLFLILEVISHKILLSPGYAVQTQEKSISQRTHGYS